MATDSFTPVNDRAFVRVALYAMAAILVSGFVVQLAMGRSSFAAPLVVHAHAVIFMGWVGISLVQVTLASAGAMALHRTLGWLAVAYSLGLLVMGPAVTLATVQTGRTPFFFQPQHFLIANSLGLLAFFGLFGAAIALRKRTDWHARLHIGAFMLLMGPGFGRLLPMPLLGAYAFDIAALAALPVALIGMARDRAVHGRVHPAWLWSVAVLAGTLLLARLIAFSPLGDAIYGAAVDGTGMAGVDGLAYPPPPPGLIG
jgi:hypothetical protein